MTFYIQAFVSVPHVSYILIGRLLRVDNTIGGDPCLATSYCHPSFQPILEIAYINVKQVPLPLSINTAACHWVFPSVFWPGSPVPFSYSSSSHFCPLPLQKGCLRQEDPAGVAQKGADIKCCQHERNARIYTVDPYQYPHLDVNLSQSGCLSTSPLHIFPRTTTHLHSRSFPPS